MELIIDDQEACELMNRLCEMTGKNPDEALIDALQTRIDKINSKNTQFC